MEILKKISSEYILKLIFDYIDEEDFKYKLVVHSKYFQKKMKITLIDYQETFLTNKGLQFSDYIYNSDNIYEETFDKNIYDKILSIDLNTIKLDRKEFDSIVFNYYNGSEEIEEIEDEEKLNKNYKDIKIDIYSPFFDIISKSKNFNLYTIPISINIIKKFNLKNDFIEVFEKMNKSNIKYESLTIYYNGIEDMNYLNELKINFNNIKKLSFCLYQDEDDDEDEDEDEDYVNVEDDEDYNNKGNKSNECNIKNYDFLKTFFSFDNFGANLISLQITLPKKGNEKLESNLLENINNFHSLKSLELTRFKFKTNFEIKLNNLIKLSLIYCENISLVGDNCINMKYLYIIESSISESKSLLKFPNLVKCKLLNYKNQKFNSIIDFSSFKNLKSIECENYDFRYIENNLLEIVHLNSEIKTTVEIEKEVIKKLILIKTLKEITLYLCEINDKEISQIKGENPSVTELIVNWNSSHIFAKLNDLQKKFPNLSKFELKLPYFEDIWGDFEQYPPIIEINPKDDCKITKISLDIRRYNNLFHFDCAPYNKLEEINFLLITNIYDLKYALPIFNDSCKIKFDSLTKFHFFCGNNKREIDFHFIKNIYDNIDCMNNLRDFSLDCIKTVDEDFYKKFIIKLLSMGLNSIYFTIKNFDNNMDKDPYTEEQLKEIYPNIDYNKYKKIFIQKFELPKKKGKIIKKKDN